jgi:hypothetical protein
MVFVLHNYDLYNATELRHRFEEIEGFAAKMLRKVHKSQHQ